MAAPNPSQRAVCASPSSCSIACPTGAAVRRWALTWRDSEAFCGESEGLASQAGELRCAAEACVKALSQAVQSGMGFELLGVKAVRAFDATVVIVSLATTGGDSSGQRVVGSYLTETDPPEARHWPCSTPPIASSATGSSCVSRPVRADRDCLRTPASRRIAPRTYPEAALHAPTSRTVLS